MSPRAEPDYGSGQCRHFGDVRHRRDGRPGNPQPVDLSARKPLCWIAPFSRHKDMSKRLLTIYISHGALHGADLAFPCKPAVNVVLENGHGGSIQRLHKRGATERPEAPPIQTTVHSSDRIPALQHPRFHTRHFTEK